MAVRSSSYFGPSGSTFVTISDLAFRKIVSVKREGIGYNKITSGTPGNRDVLYDASSGTFIFLVPFAGSIIVDPAISELEKIHIIWGE
jgi:hypothetical protein